MRARFVFAVVICSIIFGTVFVLFKITGVSDPVNDMRFIAFVEVPMAVNIVLFTLLGPSI